VIFLGALPFVDDVENLVHETVQADERGQLRRPGYVV